MLKQGLQTINTEFILTLHNLVPGASSLFDASVKK